MIGGSMNQDNVLMNMNYICELEEKDYLNFLRRIGERNVNSIGEIPYEWEDTKGFSREYEEVTNKIYLSLLSYCLSALKFLQDNSNQYFELHKKEVLSKNKNKLAKFIDVLEEYIFIDNATKVYNERWFNKIIYHEMDLVIKTNTSITFIILQLEYINNAALTLNIERKMETYLEKTEAFVAIVKRILSDSKDELFRMNANEFLIVSKEQKDDYLYTRNDYILQEVMESIQNIYLYFGVTKITREQLLEDLNVITYLKKADQEVYQYKRNYIFKQNNRQCEL